MVLIQTEDYAELSLSTETPTGPKRVTTDEATYAFAAMRVQPGERLNLSPGSVVRCWNVRA